MDSVFNPRDKNALPVSFNQDTKFSIRNANNILTKGWIGKQAYSIALDTGKKQKLFILVPFADAGQQSTWQQVWIISNDTAADK